MVIGIRFSKAFLEKFGDILGMWWNKRWIEKMIMYNLNGKGYVDVKKVFKVTAEGEMELRVISNNFKDFDNDVKILKIARYVNSNLTYTNDEVNYGKVEYWADPYEVIRRWRDDCDGFAVLIAYLGWAAGIPRYRLKVVAGEIKYDSGAIGGHAYCQYLREGDNLWYTIEGSWYAKEAFARYRKHIPHTDDMKRYDALWWSTTDKKSFAQHNMEIERGVFNAWEA